MHGTYNYVLFEGGFIKTSQKTIQEDQYLINIYIKHFLITLFTLPFSFYVHPIKSELKTFVILEIITLRSKLYIVIYSKKYKTFNSYPSLKVIEILLLMAAYDTPKYGEGLNPSEEEDGLGGYQGQDESINFSTCPCLAQGTSHQEFSF